MKKTSAMLKIEKEYGEPIKDLLYRIYVEEEKSTAQIGEMFGVTRGTVCDWMQRVGIQRRAVGEAMKQRWQDEEFRQNRHKMSEAHLQAVQSEEHRQKMREIKKQHWQDEEYRQKQSEAHLQAVQSDEYRQKLSEIKKQQWQDEEYREKMREAIGRVPNKLETYVNTLTPLNVRYVGDGSWWRYLPLLGQSKNPDFKVKGRNKVIEVFGDYWHRNDDPEKLTEAYKQVGVKCLVLWESEIHDDIDGSLNKISDFLRVTNWQFSLSI